MKNRIRNRWIAIAVVVAVLLIDQLSKIWVKTHMGLKDSIDVLDRKSVV